MSNINKLMNAEKDAITKNKIAIDEYHKITEHFIAEYQNKLDSQYELVRRIQQQREQKDYMDNRMQFGKIIF